MTGLGGGGWGGGWGGGSKGKKESVTVAMFVYSLTLVLKAWHGLNVTDGGCFYVPVILFVLQLIFVFLLRVVKREGQGRLMGQFS